MSWGTRQQRLKDMLGADSNLCFQVCVCVATTLKSLSEEEFNAVTKAQGVDLDGEDYAQIPKRNYREELFQPGYVLSMKGQRMTRTLETEAVFTAAPYKRSGVSIDRSDDLEKVIAEYAPAIEQRFDYLRFNGRSYADSDKLSVDFRFIVQPYDPDICHPADIGVLKPLTLIEGQVIAPVTSRLSL